MRAWQDWRESFLTFLGAFFICNDLPGAVALLPMAVLEPASDPVSGA